MNDYLDTFEDLVYNNDIDVDEFETFTGLEVEDEQD